MIDLKKLKDEDPIKNRCEKAMGAPKEKQALAYKV